MKAQNLILILLTGIFILLNIISSQTVSRLFFDFSTGKREAAVEFLKRIKDEDYFPRLYSGVAGFFGENLEDEVYAETLGRQRKIQELEEILILNPKALDALYSLYVLYLQEGETTVAKEYLKQAQQIDPEIKE